MKSECQKQQTKTQYLSKQKHVLGLDALVNRNREMQGMLDLCYFG